MDISEESLIQQEEYDSLVEPYGDAMSLIIVKLEALNRDYRKKKSNYPIHNIQHRIKSKKSLENKLIKRNIQINMDAIKQEITDIAGIRVICYSSQDIYDILEILNKSSEVVKIKCTDYIKMPKANGYKSYHLVLGVPVYHSDGMGYYPVEIQLRTLGMDFWASMEHRYCYKNENADNGKELFDLYRKYSDEIERLEKSMQA